MVQSVLHISKNPIIASFFTTIGNADELGSGTRNLFKYTKLYSGNNPVMKEDDIFRITIPLDNSYSFDAELNSHKIEQKSETSYTHLSQNQRKIIAEMKKNPSVTAVILSELVGISSRKIEENIKFLKENNLIAREGTNKKGTWKVL